MKMKIGVEEWRMREWCSWENRMKESKETVSREM